MSALWRMFAVLRVVCRYRLVSLLPRHPLLLPLTLVEYLHPAAWFGPRNLSEGERLQKALEELGPIFIKFGQLLATRRDLLPPEWTEALARLQDQVAPFDGAVAQAVIERELGAPVGELFGSFDIVPLASASVAQVHPATLKDGREVVVKVIRPGIEQVVTRDLRVMTLGARWLERLWRDARYFRPTRVINDYADIIRAELNLESEAWNTETMRRHFLFSPLLFIPEVHRDLTTRRVMVVERIYGIPVNDIERIKAAGIDPRVLAERGVEIFFKQVFHFNFFHADMHPGNIFVSPQNPSSPQYMSVDCAIVGRLSREDLQVLGRLALMVMRHDYAGMVDIVVRAGWATVPVDRNRFQRTVEEIVSPMLSQPLDGLEFAPLVLKLFDAARQYHIEAPVQYILLLKTLVHIEGLGRAIYPQLDIWHLARPIMEAWALEEFGPLPTLKKLQQRAPEWFAQLPEMPDMLRDALENLRQLPQRQHEQAARLETQLLRHRRKLFAGLGGGALVATGLWLGAGQLALGSAIAGALALGWALKR